MTCSNIILKQFQDYILKQDPMIASQISSTSQIGIKTQLKIYQDGYYIRLLRILALSFEKLKTQIGQVRFDRLGRKYIDTHPSHSHSIFKFGHHFPDFLKNYSDLTASQLELAEFELILEKVRSISVPSQDIGEQLGKIVPEAWSEIKFTLNPTVQIFKASRNAPHLWRALSSNKSFTASKSVVENWLVWANQGSAHFCVLNKQTECFLDAFKAGKNFGEVCEMLCEMMQDTKVGEFTGRYLNQWIKDKIIVFFTMPPV